MVFAVIPAAMQVTVVVVTAPHDTVLPAAAAASPVAARVTAVKSAAV